MTADFLDSHHRHFNDADLLQCNGRYANADHLFGVSAECGLKRLMQAFGMQVDGTGKPRERDDWKHANDIWLRYETYANGHLNYRLPSPDPFHDWNISDRYAHSSHFDIARLIPHRTGADAVRCLIRKAMHEGLIT